MKSKKNKAEPKQAARTRSGPPPPGSPGPAEPPLSTGRKWLFSIVGFVILPLLLLAGVEVALRLAGYGYATGFFKPLRIGGQECLVENDKFGLRFFPPELARSPAPVVMQANKKPGTYRIFILGESAALGDPRPAYGAGRYLQTLLQERFPSMQFEVVCTAMTAINSHAVLPIARDCAAQNGDLWIVYLGNNEMVGPFGATTVFGSKSPPRAYVRFSLALQQLRLGQLLMAAGRKLAGRSQHDSSWGGMKMFLANQIRAGDPRKEVVYASFQRNLDDLLQTARKAGVKVLLNTVAVNLKDCPPFASLADQQRRESERLEWEGLVAAGTKAEARGAFAEAAGWYDQALKVDPLYAEVEFRLGACRLAEGRTGDAREHFEKARDYDALPFRADARINQMIALAGARGLEGQVFCDAAGLMASNSPTRIPGEETFYEHVHLNFDGNYRLARLWAEQAEQFLPAQARKGAREAWAAQEICEQRLGLTDWNRYGVLEDMLQRLWQAPFTNQSQQRERIERYRAQLKEVRQRLEATAAAKAKELYAAAIQSAPEDHRLHENYAEFLELKGDLAEAVAEWQQVRDLLPHHHLAYYEMGHLLLKQGRVAECRTHLAHAVGMRPDLAEAWLELGNTYALEGKPEVALKYYERERQLVPQDYRVHYHIGKALANLDRRAEAIASLQQAVQLNQGFWEARGALGEELAFDGKIAEARTCFEEVIRQKPDYAMAHLNLGVALVRQGQLSEALRQFEETLRLEPKNTLAAGYEAQVKAALNSGGPRPSVRTNSLNTERLGGLSAPTNR